MQKKTHKSLAAAAILAVAGLSQAQDASQFKVYGFLDGGLNYYDVEESYGKQIVGSDKASLKLAHANLYFDWKPNAMSKALLELNLMPTTKVNRLNGGSEATILRLNGQVVSDEQIIDAVTAQTAMDTLQTMVSAMVPEGTPNRDQVIQQQIEQQMPGVSAMLRPYVAAGLTPVLQGVRAASNESSPTNTQTSQQVFVERAHFDILINDMANLRFGRWITPAGIWNVDHGSPVVLTINQPYQYTYTPIFPEQQEGLMVYGRTYMGDHDLGYSTWITSGRSGASRSVGNAFQNRLDELADLSVGGHLSLHLDYLKSINIGATFQTGSLRNKYIAQTLDIDFEALMADPNSLTLASYEFVDRETVKEREYLYGGDMKVELGQALLQGEMNYQKVENEMTGESFNATGFYGLLGYKLPLTKNTLWTPYAMYEQVTWVNGSNSDGIGYSGYGARGFQSTIAGLNIALFSNIRLKAEYNVVTLLMSDKEVSDFGGFRPKTGFSDGVTSTIYSTQFAIAF